MATIGSLAGEIGGLLRGFPQLIADLQISTCLFYLLRKTRGQSGSPATQKVVNKVSIYTINRGVLICALQALQIGLFLGDLKDGTIRSLLVSLPASTTYLNTILTMYLYALQRQRSADSHFTRLNARHHVSKVYNQREFRSMPLGAMLTQMRSPSHQAEQAQADNDQQQQKMVP
ncbi:uncharacterized protein LAESUDRAFT_724223 [Laetiporus sulphureus 93-53]|uniref:DUF6534 domain-containing protein n=1 Tax=Laetiporus sulphureus 93-53 TaxID=1314785 RepID=A0A165F1Z2_9APHY|nr:uncharacterized protein LAESUDRAFT_724223 [Laetiporus sulphureus 93-53]KZT08205.1 hypothetical protein LAESUDRAFT_724223 [Laetiporus sulphureus 93-53]